MFGIDNTLLAAGGAVLGGLLSKPKGNPNQWAKGQAESYQAQGQQFLDPNNQFYTGSQANFFSGLNRTLNASSPGASQLLAAQAGAGGDFGGSTYIAGKQREAQMAKNADAAGQASNEFVGGLFQRGLGAYQTNQQLSGQMYGLYGQGAQQQYDAQGSFSNELLGLGGGLFARYFGGNKGGGGNGTPMPDNSFNSTRG